MWTGGTPISGISHIPIPWLLRSLLLFGLAALALFVIGPLAGSIDDDGDGNPDIPVVVSAQIFVAGVPRVTDSSPIAQHVLEPARAPIRIHTRCTEDGHSDFSSFDGRSILLSSSLLRC